MSNQQQQLLNLLREVKHMLGEGQATPEHKQYIAEMLLKAKIFADAAPVVAGEDDNEASKGLKKKDKGSSDAGSSSKKDAAGGSSSEKKAKAPKEKAIEAECGTCGEVRTGRFVKRGFKCDSCLGTKESRAAPPVAIAPDRVPSSALPIGFERKSTSNRDAMMLGYPGAASTNPNNTSGAFGSPSITVEDTDEQANFDDMDPSSPVMRRKGQIMQLPFQAPKVKYAVSEFKAVPSTPSADSPTEVGDVGLVNSDGVVAHRLIYFPTMLYNYSLARDNGTVLVCHENADLLRARGVTLGPHNRRDYEIVMQAALSALQLLQHLKEYHDTPHGDLRPYNFFIDVHHNIKLRVAPFTTTLLLPEPFRAPDDCPGAHPEWQFDPKKKEKKAGYARDIYALGVSLTIFAYGGPELPDESDVEVGRDMLMYRFLTALRNPNANERLTIDSAMHEEFLGTIRIVNGVPVESVYCRVDVGSSGKTAATPRISSFLGRRVSGDSSSQSPSPFSFSRGASNVGRRQSIVARMPPIADTPEIIFDCHTLTAGGSLLENFFRNTGPLFQVVRATRSVTVYSVAMDPRRTDATEGDGHDLASESTLSLTSTSVYSSSSP